MSERDEMYYIKRAFVRFLFWGTMFSIVALIAYALGTTAPKQDYCDVTVNRNFTWIPNQGSLSSLETCTHPDTIRLLPDLTWEWTQ